MVKTTHADARANERRLRAERIGKVCRARREALKLTRAEAARRIGISVNYYGQLEQGNALPRLETFIAMASALQVRPDELLGLDPASEQSTASAITLDPDAEALYQRLMQTTPEIREIAVMVMDKMNALNKKRRKGT